MADKLPRCCNAADLYSSFLLSSIVRISAYSLSCHIQDISVSLTPELERRKVFGTTQLSLDSNDV